MYRTRVHSPKKGGRPTRDDVAKMANISGATVSRVLSGRTDVSISPEMRARVLEAAKSLGYQPNTSARALVQGRTGLIGFWMCLQYSRYRSQVLDRMRGLLSNTEIAMAVTDVDEEFQWSHSFSRALRVPVDGIIAFDTSGSIDAFAQNYDQLAPATPFVSMGAYWSEAKSYVGVDLRAGAEMAMDHLVGTGRKRIAYMAPNNSDLINSGARFDAYVDKAKDAGQEARTIGIPEVSVKAVKQAISECLLGSNRPDAILCMNDDISLAASFALSQLGIRVGDDIALVGFDGIEETEDFLCPLTTVRQPIEDMCALTLQFLNAQIEDPTIELQQKILKPQLVIRDSSRG